MMESRDNSTQPAISDSNIGGFDEEIAVILKWILYTVLCQTVEIFGIVSNIINIICFVKLGLNDPVNISLLGLTLADLGGLITLIWINISFTPAFSSAKLSFDVLEVFYLVAAMPHATFTRISSWITAMITLERCLCIVFPFKVNRIFTPDRVIFIIACIFIVLLTCAAPVYFVNTLELKFSSRRNATIVGIVFTADKESLEKIYFAVNNFFLNFIAFFIIFICTFILVFSLRRRITWREKAMKVSDKDVSKRNQKVAKMVVVISVLFISCFIPITLVFLSLCFEPELSIGGRLVNIAVVAGGFGVLLEAINSSVNIFIYYFMSTKYREVFRNIFCK